MPPLKKISESRKPLSQKHFQIIGCVTCTICLQIPKQNMVFSFSLQLLCNPTYRIWIHLVVHLVRKKNKCFPLALANPWSISFIRTNRHSRKVKKKIFPLFFWQLLSKIYNISLCMQPFIYCFHEVPIWQLKTSKSVLKDNDLIW